MTKHPMDRKFRILKTLFKVAIPGLALLLVAYLIPAQTPAIVVAVLAGLLFLPFFIYVYVFVILHWKYRYRGSHSDLWGVLILIETSGWFKLIYMFRHILPDMLGNGRYATEDYQPTSKSTLS